jgi:hypothetical protein
MRQYPHGTEIRPRPLHDLCGWAGEREAEAAKDAMADRLVPFAISGPMERKKSVRLWEVYRRVTGQEPDLTPQPTGNCVAASADDVIELLQAIEIAAGERESYRDIYNPYHYATGRVIIGKNRLRGGAGSIGSWQAEAIKQYGVISTQESGLPKYSKRNCDAWGDDREADGRSFRDYLDKGKEHPVKTWAFCETMDKVKDALSAGYPITIASNRGYTMKPGRDGFHRPSGNWAHQMSIWGYDETGKAWVAIKNQWGDVHGQVRDPNTGDPWPKGFICVPMEDFERQHLNLRGVETIAYSGFLGFPPLNFDYGAMA